MSTLLGSVLLALLPGLAWLWYFYRQEGQPAETAPWLLLGFALGALVVAPAVALESGLQNFWLHAVPNPPAFWAVNFFLNVAPVEEFLKFYVVYRCIYPHRPVATPAEGLLYATASALGFASAENLIYIWEMGWGIILLRGLITTLAHVLFAALWGLALGQARQYPADASRWIVGGLLLAVLVHGAYNFILMTHPAGSLFLLGLLVGCLIWSLQRWARQYA